MDDAAFRNWDSAMQRMLPALLRFAADPATIAVIALMYRRLYEALLREGFTTTEALMITAGHRSTASASASGAST